MMARVSVHECGQENNSEQHSCPTRLNSLLQLHSPYTAAFADLFLSGSLCTLLRSRTRQSAVSFSFNAVAATAAPSNWLRYVSHLPITRSPFAHATLLNPFPRIVVPQLILSVLTELHAACRWPEDTSRSHRDRHPPPPSTLPTTWTTMRASEAL